MSAAGPRPGGRRRRALAAIAAACLGATAAVVVGGSSAAADAGGPSPTPTTSSCPTSNPPNELVLAGGTPQTAQLGAAFATALAVTLANTDGCPLSPSPAGTAITFTAPASRSQRGLPGERRPRGNRRERPVGGRVDDGRRRHDRRQLHDHRQLGLGRRLVHAGEHGHGPPGEARCGRTCRGERHRREGLSASPVGAGARRRRRRRSRAWRSPSASARPASPGRWRASPSGDAQAAATTNSLGHRGLPAPAGRA